MDMNGAGFLSFVDEMVEEEEGHLRQMEAGSFTRSPVCVPSTHSLSHSSVYHSTRDCLLIEYPGTQSRSACPTAYTTLGRGLKRTNVKAARRLQNCGGCERTDELSGFRSLRRTSLRSAAEDPQRRRSTPAQRDDTTDQTKNIKRKKTFSLLWSHFPLVLHLVEHRSAGRAAGKEMGDDTLA